MPKASGLAIISPVVSWHLVAARVSLGVPPEKGGAGLENPSLYQMYALASRRHFSVAPAGNPFAFYGGRCVGIFGSAGLVHTGFRARTVRHLYRWRCYLSCTEHCHEHIGLPFPARAVRSGQRRTRARTVPTPSSPRCAALAAVWLRTASLGRSGINCLGGAFSWRMRIVRWRGCAWWRS